MIDLLAAWTFRALALAFLVAGILRLARVRNPFLGKTVWTAVLTAVLIMPIVIRLHGLAIHTPIPVLRPLAASPGVAVRHTSVPFLWALYVLSVALFAMRYAGSFLRMAWIRRRACRVYADWTQELDVRSSQAIVSPATFGRTILLPASFADWDADQRAAVIAHERAHVLGFDCYRIWLARLYVCVAWFNPLSWWLARRLTTLAEETSDAAAVQALGDGPRYAETLLEFAARAAAPSPVAAAIVRSNISKRIERIIGTDPPSAPPRRSRSLLAVAAAMPALVLCALLQFQPAYRAHAGEASTHPAATHSALRVLASVASLKLIRGAYPVHAVRTRQSGWAYLRITVDSHGHATHVRLIKVVPAHAGFGNAALRVARTLRYHNTTGHTVVETLPIRFRFPGQQNSSPKHL